MAFRAQLDDFATLYERTYPALFRMALGICGDAGLAADVTQDAYESAYRQQARFKGDVPIDAWLHRIVVNAALSGLRRRRVRWAEPLDPLRHDRAGGACAPTSTGRRRGPPSPKHRRPTMAADDPFERRLSASLHAALDAVNLPHPTWASSPAARRVGGRSSGASRRGALWLLAAAVLVGVVGSALFVAGGALPLHLLSTTPPTPSTSAGLQSGLPSGLDLVGQAPGSAGHAEGPIVALGVSIQPTFAEDISFWSWDPASQAWTPGPVVPQLSGRLQGVSDGSTVAIDVGEGTGRTVSLAAVTADASWRQVALPDAMATPTGWDPTGALLTRPAGGYVASRAAMLLVINDDGTTRTAATPAAAPIVMAGTSDPDWYVVTTLAGMHAVSQIHLPVPYPAQLWNAATGALVPLGDVDDVAPAYAGLAYVRTGDPTGSDWQLATPNGLEMAVLDAANTEIDPTGRLLFERESACILDATASAPRDPVGACLTALPNGGDGLLSADGLVLWGLDGAFVTPLRTPAAGPFPVELGLAMLSAAGPRLIGFPPFATRPAPTPSPSALALTPSPVTPDAPCGTSTWGSDVSGFATPQGVLSVGVDVDKATFTFASLDFVSISVTPATPPFDRDPSGIPVTVQGSRFWRIVFHNAEGQALPAGALDQSGTGGGLVELVEIGDFEGVQTWILGTAPGTCAQLYVNPTTDVSVQVVPEKP